MTPGLIADLRRLLARITEAPTPEAKAVAEREFAETLRTLNGSKRNPRPDPKQRAANDWEG